MTEFHNIEGVERPCRFGFAALYEYETRYGRSAMDDFNTTTGLGSVSVQLVVNLAYCGYVCGHRKENKNIDFTEHDVADWMNPELIEKVLVDFAASFPKVEDNSEVNGDAQDSKKKE